jgi:hypothetical protein
MAKITFKYGLGNKSVFTAGEVLEAIKAPVEYAEMAGNGLSIAGLNVPSLEMPIRFSESTTKLTILAPEMDPIDVECEFTGDEDDLSVLDEPAE